MCFHQSIHCTEIVILFIVTSTVATNNIDHLVLVSSSVIASNNLLSASDNQRRTTYIVCCCAPQLSDWESRQRLLVMYSFHKHSQLMTCPSCRSAQDTHVVLQNTKKTHAMAALLTPALFCWFPYVTKNFRVAIHYCSVCGAYIGRSDVKFD